MRHAVIIGAGVIGAASAVEALAAGLRVTLVDPGPAGGEQAASYGNAGWLSSHSIIPPSGPGMWKDIPGYLLDPLGPLAIRWRHLPRAAPWLLRHLAAAWTHERVRAIASALRPLLRDAPQLHLQLARRAGVAELISPSGVLHVYPSRAHFESEAPSWRIRRELGVTWDELDEQALRRREPALDSRYRFAVRVNEAGRCHNPGRYVAALAAHARESGAAWIEAAANSLEITGGRLRAVHLHDGRRIECDAAVIAAGVRSAALAAQAGDRLPLAAERGYHATLDLPGGPRETIMASDRKLVVNRMETGLRVAGQVEIAAIDAAPDWGRAQILRDHLLDMFPELPRDIPQPPTRYWLGCRPSMPDGIPCIGHASASADVIHAFGHGHVGLAGAARTALWVARLLSGREEDAGLKACDPGRFGRRPMESHRPLPPRNASR
ncbi:MAG TPA: FAD-dependent oxidoreductase [Burkholderiaceae bacterium]|nr:FAD-dependent oxidoreductase [Burkholderiaceae bacterium]